jgi:DNA-directed RNA polymerase subunit RPC12/RpoP
VSTTDRKSPQYAGPCPRCGGRVPNDVQAGQYPGALSRLDNETYICSACGQDEAMYQFSRSMLGIPADLPAFKY